MAKIEKARYWVGVLYPENMIEDWEIEISDILGYPYAYCIHDKDLDSKTEERKVHVHLMIAYGNTTTKNSVETLFNKLSKEDKICCPGVQSVSCVRNMYEYLIHNTDTSKKKGKHLYEKSERIVGNNFDIGAYEQLGLLERNEIFKELGFAIIENNITNMEDLFLYVVSLNDINYFEVFKANGSLLEKLTRARYSNFMKTVSISISRTSQEKHTKKTHEKCCKKCGSLNIMKNGQTQAGRGRMRCKDCGKSWSI